jgi:hypothetical protein
MIDRVSKCINFAKIFQTVKTVHIWVITNAQLKNQ